MKRIVVSVSNDLTNDQRVLKVCHTLYSKGYDVLVIGRKLNNSLPTNFPYSTKRLRLVFNKGFLFYLEFNLRLFFVLLFQKKDMLLANDMDTLLPNQLIHKLQGVKLVFDSHELFSEIPELVHRKFVKKVWCYLEQRLIPKQQFGFTVSPSIAKHYKKLYNVDFKVIKNYPKILETDIPKNQNPFSNEFEHIILYQGAINIGRGLELMIDAMKYLDNHLFVLAGDGDIRTTLQQKVQDEKLTNKIRFLGKLRPEELKQITPFASLGISLEEDLGLNYCYALPNKIFDYIQAEIPILISDLPEMKKIVTDYNVGTVLKDRNPKDLAELIDIVIKNDYTQALKNAKKELIWEKQEAQLLAIFQ